jgi:sugar/nucleoside kinase (ribokinase family)
MKNKTLKLLGIGNSIVDVIAYKDVQFLEQNNFPKGSMKLVDFKTCDDLYNQLGSAIECSGGSAANTLAGFAMLGGSASFVGKVKDDLFGNLFISELDKVGVKFVASPAKSGDPTGRCVIFVTEEKTVIGNMPKIERTMATYLGASTQISEADIKLELIEQAEVIFFEGYLFDSPSAAKAIYKAIEIAEASDTKIAFTLSDPFCVDRHREEFRKLVDKHVDILFSNESEIKSLFQIEETNKALSKLQGVCEVACITRGDKGSYIIWGDGIYDIEVAKVDEVYDVTGAGDLYAAGFLYGYTHNLGPEKSGKLASQCAAEVIKYLGGRPNTRLDVFIETL